MTSQRATDRRVGRGTESAGQTTSAAKKDRRSWATLSRCLHGRTLHVNALSPLHLHNIETGESSRDTLSSDDLDRVAARLLSYLSTRLDDNVFASTSQGASHERGMPGREMLQQRSASRGLVQNVRAAFLLHNQADNSAKEAFWDSALQPWAIEIDLKAPVADTAQETDEDEPRQGKAKSKTERAHLVFVSSSKRRSESHYPLLLYKAPNARVFTTAATNDEMGEEGEDAAYQQQQPSSRVFTAHLIDFLGRYFDCRVSTLPPQVALRGKGLESLTEHLLQQARADVVSNAESSASSYAIELTYSLPRLVRDAEEDGAKTSDEDDDIAGMTSLRFLKTLKRRAPNVAGQKHTSSGRHRIATHPGPAPDLDTLGLSVPPAVAQALLTNNDRADILPVVSQYLAEHTSLLLSRMTLVRVGVAGVFVGAPSSSLGGGELRIKFLHGNDGAQTSGRRGIVDGQADTRSHIPAEQSRAGSETRIAATLQHLMTLVDGPRW